MISVIIPIYNVEEYLYICINSVLNQTYQDFEIICIDDASTDSSLEVLEYFSKKDSRVKILMNDSNHGPGYSRNKCLDVSQGKYVFFLDADDWISPNTFEILIKKIEQDNLDALLFKNIVFYDEPQEFGFEKYYDMEFMDKFNNKVFNHWDLDKRKIFSIPIGACNKLYLKSFLDKNNIRFTNENYIHEDNLFTSKVILTANRISLLNIYCYNRRRRNGSIMTLNNERIFDIIPIIYLIVDVFLEDKEIYEYYKETLLSYIFNSVLNRKYEQIDDRYKKEFFNKIQEVYVKFIKEYYLCKDIKKYVNEDILNKFKFEEILRELNGQILNFH